MRHLLFLPLLLAAYPGVAQAASPAPFVATYELSQGSVKFGTLERRLELGADGSYTFSARMETSGIAALLRSETVRETSRGHLRDARFAPESYEYTSSRGKRQFALVFERSAGRVRRDDPGSQWSAAVPADTVDKLVYQAQMMLDLETQPATLSYTVADKDKVKNYAFANRGAEEVETAAGTYRAVRLERGTQAADRQTTVWCAAGLGWLPIKVEYREKDGSVTTARLRNLHTTP